MRKDFLSKPREYLPLNKLEHAETIHKKGQANFIWNDIVDTQTTTYDFI